MFDKLFGKNKTPTLSSTIENIVSDVNPLEGMTVKEKSDLGNTLTKISEVMVYAIIIVVPVFFVPVLSDALDLPKQTVLFFLAGIALLLWFVKGLITKKFAITTSPLHLPILAFLLVTIISAFLADNKYVALSADTVAIAGATFLFLLISNLTSKEGFINKAATALLAAGAILGVISAVQLAYQAAAPTLNLTINFFFLNPTFSPAGSPLAQELFLVAILPLAIALYVQSKNRPVVPILLLGLNILGILTTAYVLYQSQPILLDQSTGWKVAANSLGGAPQIINAFFGVGPGHFLDAFTSFKPLAFNSSPWWNLRFSTSSNFYFYVLTTLGIAGLAAFSLLVFKFTQLARIRLQTDNVTPIEKGLIIAISLSLILFAFLPAPLISVFVLFTLLGLLIGHYHSRSLSMFASDTELNQPTLKYVITAVLAITIVGAGYYLGQFVAADYFFAQSFHAAAANNGQQTYELQIKALGLNPWNSGFRVQYSLTNLQLANSLAGQKDLSDDQKQIVVTLVQQALREGRIAASLQPRRAGNWENLSLIYRNLINFAQGADQWAVQSENQAITLDPTNPRLRLDLGGILFAAQDFQSAAQIFNAAANLKPDFANAHYNLAQALKSLKINDQALQQLQLTATLVCNPPAGQPQGAQNTDCQKVNAEIDLLNTEASPSAQIKPTTEVQSPLATPAGAPKTDLPKARTQPPAQVSTQSGELQPSL